MESNYINFNIIFVSNPNVTYLILIPKKMAFSFFISTE